MWQLRGKLRVHTKFWWGNKEETVYLEDAELGGRIILKRLFKEKMKVLTGLMLLRI